MGQKTDTKNIIQVKKNNNNYIWNAKYFEKKNNESYIHIFNNIEIKKFLTKILKDNNLVLHTYDMNISEYTIKIFISYFKSFKFSLNKLSLEELLYLIYEYPINKKIVFINFPSTIQKKISAIIKTPQQHQFINKKNLTNNFSKSLKECFDLIIQFNPTKKQGKNQYLYYLSNIQKITINENFIKKNLLSFFIKKKDLLIKNLKINKLYYYYNLKIQLKKILNNTRLKNQSNIQKLILNTSLKYYIIYNNYKKKLVNNFFVDLLQYFRKIEELNIVKKKLEYSQIKNLLEKFIESLQIFNNRNYKTILTLQQINQNINFNLTFQQLQLLKKTAIQLRQFKETNFFQEGINLIFSTLIQKKSAQLLADFIATKLKTIKRQGFFFKFLKKSMTILINHSLSNVKSIKIIINGRFNSAPRSKKKVISINKNLSFMTLDSSVYYYQATAYGSNGTFGIKLWVNKNN